MSDPIPTEAMKEEAKKWPNGWIYAIDPFFDPNGRVPADGIMGAWAVDGNGNITGEFIRNPGFRPRSQSRGQESQ